MACVFENADVNLAKNRPERPKEARPALDTSIQISLYCVIMVGGRVTLSTWGKRLARIWRRASPPVRRKGGARTSLRTYIFIHFNTF
jgi:hypothetical protein